MRTRGPLRPEKDEAFSQLKVSCFLWFVIGEEKDIHSIIRFLRSAWSCVPGNRGYADEQQSRSCPPGAQSPVGALDMSQRTMQKQINVVRRPWEVREGVSMMPVQV